jgi:hypothetical protein
MELSAACSAAQIQQNTAKGALDTAKQTYQKARTDFLSCQGPQAQGAAAVQDAQPDLERVLSEAESVANMNAFLLEQLEHEAKSQSTMTGVAEMVGGEAAKIQEEITRLKSEIRTERRRFLDADPSVSPAVGGFYFTRVPDNRVLIGFLIAFGAFLLFGGLLILLNQIPGIMYFTAMATGERVKFVLGVWGAAIVLMYIGFFVFT